MILSRGRLVFIFVSLATVFLLVTGSLLASTAGDDGDDGKDSLRKYLSVFTEVLGLVQQAYVDEPETEALVTGALEGTVDALDPFSLYVPAPLVDRYDTVRSVGFTRSGLLILKERGVAYAALVEDGSPAAEAGIGRGDVISQVAGRSTRKSPLFEIHSLLAGEPGEQIEVEYLHMGVKETVTVELGEYPRPGVELEVASGLPVLKIGAFHGETPGNVATSLAILADENQSSLPGLEATDKLLIDLRGVTGGDEAAAYEVAGFFASGELGMLKERGEIVRTFTDDAEPRFTGRLVVLIDRGTQGPAEVLASVLTQSSGATLVGPSPSFGHSGRQSLVPLSNGGGLLLTDAFFTGPDGEPLTESLEPDVLVRRQFSFADEAADEEAAEEGIEVDEVLDKGLEVLRDEVEADAEPQRAA